MGFYFRIVLFIAEHLPLNSANFTHHNRRAGRFGRICKRTQDPLHIYNLFFLGYALRKMIQLLLKQTADALRM